GVSFEVIGWAIGTQCVGYDWIQYNPKTVAHAMAQALLPKARKMPENLPRSLRGARSATKQSPPLAHAQVKGGCFASLATTKDASAKRRATTSSRRAAFPRSRCQRVRPFRR